MEAEFNCIELTEVHRQKKGENVKDFVRALNAIRLGTIKVCIVFVGVSIYRTER